MAELTLEQKRAVAMASARLRLQQGGGGALSAAVAPWDQRDASGVPGGQATGHQQMPTAFQQAIGDADGAMRIAADSMTFGGADRLAGRLNGTGADHERQLTEQARNDAGPIGNAVDIGAGSLVPMHAGAEGLTLAGRFGTDMLGGVRGLIARIGLAGFEGAGYGALNAAGHGQDIGHGAEFGALGGVGGNVLGEGVAAGTQKIVNALAKKAPTRTVADFMAAKDAAYKAAESEGVKFAPQAVDRLSNAADDALSSVGFSNQSPGSTLQELAPGALAAKNNINAHQGLDLSLSDMENIRKVAGAAFRPGNKTNNSATGSMINSIDDLFLNPNPGDVVSGDSVAAGAALKDARNYYHQGSKLQKVESLFDRGEAKADASGSGGNFQNATRQQLNKILQNKGWDRGFTPDELGAVKNFVKGGNTQNIMRAVGAMAPAGNALMKAAWGGAAGIGGLAYSPYAALAVGGGAAASVGAKKIAEAMTRRSFENVRRTIANGGANIAPTNTLSEPLAKIARALAISGANRTALHTDAGPATVAMQSILNGLTGGNWSTQSQ